MIAFAGSFQDIAIDAFRIELAGIEEQGNLAAYYQFGYRGAILTATSFALIYAENYSWGNAYFLMAALMLMKMVFGGCLDPDGLSYLEYFANGEIELINASSDVDSSDPNGDDWNYSEGSSNYEKVNGTEGNGTGERIQTGGKYPDTEDWINLVS